MRMILKPEDVGVLVEHSVWKRGKVIEILSPYAIIHFPTLATSPQGPQRKLREDAPQLSKSSVQSDPELDAVETGPAKPRKVSKRKVKDVAHPIDDTIAWFEQTYPGKFADEKFVTSDVTNKRAAQEVFTANFGDGRGAAMVDQGKHAEIATALDGIFRSTNILSPFEVKAVHKALVKGDESATKVLGTTLAFVAGPGPDDVQEHGRSGEPAAGRRRQGAHLADRDAAAVLRRSAAVCDAEADEHRVDGGADVVRLEIRLDAELGDLRRDVCGWPRSCCKGSPHSAPRDMIDVHVG